ncbi:MAG: ACP S-malonyltransferase [Candidatus Limnocylindrales bacterium]
MTHLAFVFPGQGSQYVGMGRALAESSPEAAAVFRAADEALGEHLSQLAWEGPEDVLNRTENSQPALLAASVAYLQAVRERWAALQVDVPEPAFAAGHSMGQYTALVASGALDLADAIRLVRTRGQLMQASGAGREGRMAAIIGLDDARLPDLVALASVHGVFGIANRNSPGQVVVSGERAAVEASLAMAKTLGARRAIELPVSVAAHSPLMAEAAQGMAEVLAGITFRDPTPPLLANADATLITTADACRAELVNHLTTGVDWVGAIRSLRSRGINTFIEVGPGQVLTGLVKRIVDDAIVLALDDKAAADRLAIPFAESAGVDFDTVA